jgi:hypothetical protein
MAKELTRELAIQLLGQAVAERGPKYVYANPDAPGMCTYVHGYKSVLVDPENDDYESETVQDGPLTPGCVVGNVLHRFGVPLEVFAELNINEDTPVATALSGLEANGHLNYTRGAQIVLSVAQNNQDQGCTWGASVEVAVRSA